MGWFTDEIEHSDRYRVLLDVSDHLWRGGVTWFFRSVDQ